MRIFIENKSKVPPIHNGKGKFAHRLAKAICSLGHDVVDNARSCDINFRMNAIPSSSYGKRVVRLDNACYSREAMHVRNMRNGGNDQVRRAIEQADGIVYQSSVSRNMCEGIFGIRNSHSAIIPNGVNPSDFQAHTVPLRGRKNYMMACQFLHPLRRLPKLLECWSEFVKDKDDAFFYLVHGENIGGVPIPRCKNMEIMPLLNQSELNDMAHSCDATIFLTFQDSCPNFAAESLACGTPLIVNNTNGILEFIDERHAIEIPVDGPHQLGMCDWETPPFQRGETLIEALDTVYRNEKSRPDFPSRLHIANIAEEYIGFFEEILQV